MPGAPPRRCRRASRFGDRTGRGAVLGRAGLADAVIGSGSLVHPWTSTSPPNSPSSSRASAAWPRTRSSPRAREIDATGEYPTDLFEAFRAADLLGLCLPIELGGSGAGILGLTIAIEEVAKYSNAAALMLLLTRLPVGPVLIAGNDDQKQRYLPGIATGELRAAFGLSEAVAGSRRGRHADPGRPRPRPDARAAGC